MKCIPIKQSEYAEQSMSEVTNVVIKKLLPKGMSMSKYDLEQKREKIYRYELYLLKNSIGDFRLFFQEASHCNDTLLKALHSAYLNAYKTGAAVDYAELGQIFAGLITNELLEAAEELTSDRMVKEYV